MRIVQITDLHVLPEGDVACGRFDTNTRLRSAVQHINAMEPQPEAVLATGDLVDGGTVVEYRMLRQILSGLRAPVYLLRGNHDDVANVRRIFPDHDYLQGNSAHLQYAITIGDLRVVAIDSLRSGTHHGGYCRERADWLEDTLRADTETPTLLAMHHPPFETGMPSLDRYGFDGLDLLTSVIRRHRQLQWLVCGHIHRAMTSRWLGLLAMTTGSTSHQLVLDLANLEYDVGNDPPRCRVLNLAADGSVWSHISLIDVA
jgi:3',5'-cyclic AMP phosphodiesterase CpdA